MVNLYGEKDSSTHNFSLWDASITAFRSSGGATHPGGRVLWKRTLTSIQEAEGQGRKNQGAKTPMKVPINSSLQFPELQGVPHVATHGPFGRYLPKLWGMSATFAAGPFMLAPDWKQLGLCLSGMHPLG